MKEKDIYFDYVANVLGVKSILLEPAGAVQQQEVPVLFCVENLPDYTAAERELLGKMVSAVKLEPEQFVVADQKIETAFLPQFTVYFLDENVSLKPAGPRSVVTYSPRFLLKNAQFKKNAWEELQKVIQFLKQNSRP